jgi:hypothetical protein
MIFGSNQKLLMARAGVKPPADPFTFLGSTAANQTGTSVSVSRPAFAKDGDVIILGIRDSAAGTGITVTGPSGFTTIVSVTGGTFLSTGGYWAKKLTSSDTGPFSFTTSVSRTWGLTSVTLASCDIGSSYGGVAIDGSTFPSVTPTQNGNLIIMAMARTGLVISSTTPSTTVLLADGSARGSYFNVGATTASTTYGSWTLDQSGRILTGYVNLVT